MKIKYLSLFLILTLNLSSQEHIIKFATLAPEGSTWIKLMREYDEIIRKESGGKLGFKIYAGGVAGDEKDVLRKIKIGQYHSAGITGVGLGEISPQVRILDSPFLFRNHAEIDFVLKSLDEEFQNGFNQNGFILLGWAEVGFVYTFTNAPIYKISDLKNVKMWSWEGDPVAEATFKALNANVFPLSITDVRTSLQTKLIDGFYTSPLAAISLQWFTMVKYLHHYPLANAAGAVVVSKKEFDKLPPDLQKILLVTGKQVMRKLTLQSRVDNEKSLQILKKKLQFTLPINEKEIVRYNEVGKNARLLMADKLYSKDFMERIESVLSDYRAKNSK